MKKSHLLIIILLCLPWLMGHAQKRKRPAPIKNWTELRKEAISNVSYDLTFYIPADPEEKVTGMSVVTFFLTEKTEVALDFHGRFTGTYIINDKKRKIMQDGGYIIIQQKHTRPGANRVVVSFESKDNGLIRNKEYLYTNFTQGQASTCFPCFDQPDIRATFRTHLNLPEGWKAMTCNSRSPVSTHMYSFIAGEFEEQSTQHEHHLIRALYRKQDIVEEKQLPKIMDETSKAVQWMEDYTRLPYPFEECGLLILPSAQFEDIEYAGAIRLTDPHVFTGASPSKEEKQERSKLIAHETAHLWFGNMVSPIEPGEAWSNEVFANLMASKMTRPHHPKSDYELNFLTGCQARAMAMDATNKTRPIAQRQQAVDHSFYLNDPIVSDKGAVMMRFLEEIVGEKQLQASIQAYLYKYYYKPASWDNFIEILNEHAPESGILQFSDAWVKQKGMPTINTIYQDGRLVISQTDPNKRGLFWRQQFEIRLIYDFDPSRTITVDMNEPVVCIDLKKKPSYIIPNYDGRGYGHFTMEDEYTKRLPLRIIVTRDDPNRFALLLTIFDNYLMGRIPPSYFGELYRDMLKEKNPLIMQTAIDHMMKIALDCETPTERQTLEQCIMDLLPENRRSECRQTIIRKMASYATAPEVLNQLYNIWQAQSDPLFNEHDYMEMAYRLAIMRPREWQDILNRQRMLLKDNLTREEFDFVSRACTPDTQTRQNLANSLKKPQEKQQKQWVQHVLRLLNDR